MENTPQPASISFSLDPTTAVPTFMQIVNQVEDAIRMGYLKDGDQLPRVKDVVTELAINPNTVLKAYRELEVRGLTDGRQGIGTFVTLREAAIADGVVGQLVQSFQEGWLREARELGIDPDTVLAIVKMALASAKSVKE